MIEAYDIDETIEHIIDLIQKDEHADLHMYEELAPVFDHLFGRAYDYDLQVKLIDQALGESSSPRVLDVGCGTGGLLKLISDQYPDGSFHGVDPAKSMVEIARSRLSEVSNVRLECTDIHGVTDQYDMISAFNILPHIETDNLTSFFEQIECLLSDSGKVVVDYKSPSDNPNGLYETWDAETDRFTVTMHFTTVNNEEESYKLISYEFKPKNSEEVYYTSEQMEMNFQTPDEIRRALQEAGLDCLSVQKGIGVQSGTIYGGK